LFNRDTAGLLGNGRRQRRLPSWCDVLCYRPAMSWLLAAIFGLALGLRHALDPDHVAAVATLLPTESRRDAMRRGVSLGASWGLGHAVTLGVSVAALSLLRIEWVPMVPVTFELAVSAMLIGLGARTLWQSWRYANRGHAAAHRHGADLHTHPMTLPHLHIVGTALAWRPFLIGSLHGLAGSGGMMILLSTRQETGWQVVGFTAAFVIGSIASMAMVTAAGALAMGTLHRGWHRLVTAIAGATSVAVGVAWALPQLAALR
jgi:High-affinity nickel-transport protein